LSVAEGWAALEDADWERARAIFESEPESAESLDGLGLARWFGDEVDDGVALRERAFEAYVADGDCDRAARVATWISRQYLISGRASAANGWLARAERALAAVPECSGHGWVAVEHARGAPTAAEAAALAERALAIAREHGDADLESCALSVLGRAQIAGGDVDDGFARLDEAMAAATAGRIRNVHTLGDAYCNLITAATAAGDWDRAREWCRLVDEFAEERGISVLFGACRTVHADVLAASGQWEEAEAALGDAVAAHRRAYATLASAPLASLALLRVRQGRLAEAEELLADRAEEPIALLALAELRLAEAEPASAAALLERAIAVTQDDAMTEARVLAPLVAALIAVGDLDGARSAYTRLDELAVRSARRLVRARASLSAARLALADDDGSAAAHAQSALEAFRALEMPHEAAESRLELARALASDVPRLAQEEARASLAAFKELGAARGAAAASAVLRALGGDQPTGLTARELEVLSLVARGLTNAGIAEELFITEKTAGHHVGRILAKLGVRNRAEAAAHAARLVG
jgi:ATP/maltotriose-dependent transcriptional regulator MalT